MVVDREEGPALRLEAPGVTAAVDARRGGRIASLRVGGRELLVGPSGAGDDSIRWGCYLMAPWPGRLAGGRLRWRDRWWQLDRTHGRNAIHGVTSSAPWTVEQSDLASATLSISLDRGGWPFRGSVVQHIRLEPGRLVLEAEIHAYEAMPAALGWHPWFLRRGEVAVRVDADRVLELRHMLPTGATRPVHGRLDLRAGPALGRRRLDDVYLDARPPIEVRWPDLTLRLETEPWLPTVVVYSPAGAICVEPQTAWPNALGLEAPAARSAGAVDLARGESLRAALMLSWETSG
ncbi:MAG: aldose 1-epimerase [Chloroflexota bacterium]